MRNLYQLYFAGAVICIMLGLLYFFMGNGVVVPVQMNLYVNNDATYASRNNNLGVATWVFLLAAFFCSMYYLNSIMDGKTMSLRSYLLFLVVLLLFLAASIVTMYAYNQALTTIPFTTTYLYDDKYKNRQNLLSTSFILFFFMSFFIMLYLYSDSNELWSNDPLL